MPPRKYSSIFQNLEEYAEMSQYLGIFKHLLKMFNSAKVYLFPILFVCPELVKALLSTSKTAAFNQSS